MNLETILFVVGSLVGFPTLIAFLIDVGKWAGVVTDGTAPKWSAFLNLLLLVSVAVLVNFFPAVVIPGLDEKVAEIVKFATLILGYVYQIFGTKLVHDGLLSRVTSFSFSRQKK